MKTAIILGITLFVLFPVHESDASCRSRCRWKCFRRRCGAYFAAQRGPFCLCKCYRCANESVTKIDIKQIKEQSSMSHQQIDNFAEEQTQFIQ
uniref:Pseudomytilin 3 n=1 Tax=Mytilus galloprovincialis TaxID=29158 RepID=A0A6B9XL67_MYTGA|nr:pseudomytilin 3 [Mytilus galloprovincialis]